MRVRHLVVLMLAVVPVLAAQSVATPPEVALDAAARAEIIDRALAALNDAYVFPDVAKKMEEAIRARHRRGEYDAVRGGAQFAKLLTAHLREVSRDAHLSVDFFPQPPPPPAAAPGASGQTLEERQRTIFARQNFGFARLERLAGNVGYLDLRGFLPPAFAGETAAAVMTVLANADAVIIDLRHNGGGDPNMVAFITSYLVGPRPIHLNDFYDRTTNEMRSSWTLAHVPGRRLTHADVYILTSARTFSGAEEFAYNLKHLKRAVLVGETTGGGAHTVRGRRLNDRFAIAVPSGRPINAITKSNWEGVGVEPDVKVAPQHALKVAHLLALEKQQHALGTDAAGLRNEAVTMGKALREELGDLAIDTAASTASDAPKPVPAAQAGDDFESGDLAAWRVDIRGAGGWYTYRNGRSSPLGSRTDGNFPFDVPDPPLGRFAALTEGGPGRHILYRDVTLDGRYRLHLTVFYVNSGRWFSAVTTSGRNRISEEQQYRIDLVSPLAPVDSTASEHVLATVFQAQPDDPLRRPATNITFDLSAWAGQTVRLRLAAANNQAPMRAGVDGIRFERIDP